MPTYTELYGIENYNETTMNGLIATNLVSFFDWGLLNIGAYSNVESGVVDGYGVDLSSLQPVEVAGTTDRRVWQSRHMNWVWESGLKYTYIDVSGVHVDGTYYPMDESGQYAHYYDYRLGRVVFDDPVPESAVVTINHSYKHVHVSHYNEEEMNILLQSDIDIHFDSTVIGSGDFNVDGGLRRQLPMIAVEVPVLRNSKPYELGHLSQLRSTHTTFHILSTSREEVGKLFDIIDYQAGRTIMLYDVNLVASGDAFPIDYRGMRTDNAKIYPDMVKPLSEGGYRVENFLTSRFYFKQSVPGNIQDVNSSLFYGTIKIIGEVIL